MLGADPVTRKFDLVDLNVLVCSSEVAKQVDGNCRGIAEIGLGMVLGRSYWPTHHSGTVNSFRPIGTG